MKKKIIVTVIFIGFIISNIFCITLADLDIDKRIIVKDLIIEINDEITLSNFESLEFVEYHILYEMEGYIIIIVDDELIVVQTEE